MRRERPRDRAARRGLHHRRFDFEIVLRIEERANVGDDRRARAKNLAAFLVDDQVDIALPVARFLIGQAVEFFRQRPQRLGQQAHFVRHDGQLAGLGAKQRAARRDDVADIPFLECLIDTFGQAVALEAHLDLPGAILQLDEAGLAHDALRHHAARPRLTCTFSACSASSSCVVKGLSAIRRRSRCAENHSETHCRLRAAHRACGAARQ